MRAFGYVIMTMLGLLAWAGAAGAAEPSPNDPGPHLAIRLVAETTQPAAGSEVTLALDTTPQPGWHGYWENPGDAGFPAKLDWKLPAGATISPPRYPMPGTLLIAGLMNYVFETPYAPLVTLKIPAGLAMGTALPIKLHAQYLVCTREVCVPEQADLTLALTVGNGAIDPATRTRFDGWRRALPRPLGGAATFQASGGKLRIAIPYPASAPLDQGYFFPVTTGLVDYAAPQTVTRDGDRLVVETKAGGAGATGPLAGVLRVGAGQALAISATAGSVAASVASAATSPARGVWSATLIALAGALLGGLILNIMPCVFPILSLKALSLARGHLDERQARHEALAYTAGVVAVCLALGGAILGLRAGGSAVGWAFQLQDARVVIVLLLLTVALSLNLGGLFEIPTPGFVNSKGGAGGAFATGALAAFIATPCTGPFMGAALGAALVLPWPAALAVFAGLGIGLALPFLAIGFVPALRKRLPRPGAWMEHFRRWLSIPMWLTALALAWVLGRQTGVDGMTLGLCAALGLALMLWAAGRRQKRGLGFGTVTLVLLAGITIWGVAVMSRTHRPATATAQVEGAEAFSEARLAALRAQGRPVFAYFTADWCLTCKVNEKAAIETDATRAAFAQHKVAVLVGDWTNGDAALGRFIEAHNRAGVPLYLYYAPGAAEPQVLPQVLTPGMLAGLGG
ncbi:protein-disulfide reductase DsbD family protein [Sphingomonas sp. AR_OL41]|uniref:protein-disulfide reductase DsbD family protein n=1 Tax=Sphingomonas sp. AR_OL41 TaxID=3042729 RepID=UPI002481116B|nr:thioredoxin family protein [Sphingomonas sp. AR_OL41]MDH7971848.1 protein-disulfide reductase DsbD family protein [Sphingomonas sp. AR_OL41]